MKLRPFLNAVPKSFHTAARILVGVAVLVGVIVGFYARTTNEVAGPVAGLGFGLLAGFLAAVWVLCLGYVYADARRRAMPPVLSTLMAAFVPNLLGFLIYFVIRRPIALPCAQCGQPMRADHPFCSWCGYQGPVGPPAPGGPQPPQPAAV